MQKFIFLLFFALFAFQESRANARLYGYVGRWQGRHVGSNKIGQGTAELIAPSWAITAKHVATAFIKDPSSRNVRIIFGGANIVGAVKAYPAPGVDVALVKLKRKVNAVTPISLLNIPLTKSHGRIVFTMSGTSGGFRFFTERTGIGSGTSFYHYSGPNGRPGKAGDSGGAWLLDLPKDKDDVLFAIIHGGGKGPQLAPIRKWIDKTLATNGEKATWKPLPRPDFYVKDLVVTPKTSSTFTYKVTVCNRWLSTLSPFKIHLFTNANGPPNCGARPTQSWSVSGLALQKCVTRSFVGSSMKPGSYTAWAFADAACKVKEESESNNKKSKVYQRVAPGTEPGNAGPEPTADAASPADAGGAVDAGSAVEFVKEGGSTAEARQESVSDAGASKEASRPLSEASGPEGSGCTPGCSSGEVCVKGRCVPLPKPDQGETLPEQRDGSTSESGKEAVGDDEPGAEQLQSKEASSRDSQPSESTTLVDNRAEEKDRASETQPEQDVQSREGGSSGDNASAAPEEPAAGCGCSSSTDPPLFPLLFWFFFALFLLFKTRSHSESRKSENSHPRKR